MSRFAKALWNDRLTKPVEFVTMMVTALASFIALVAAGFVYHQIQDVRRSLDSQAYGLINQQLNELNKIFVEHPETRSYFQAAKVLPDDEKDRQRILTIANMHLDFIDSYYAQLKHLDWSNYDLCGWYAFFKNSFERSPVLCAVLCASQDEYGDAAKIIAAANCKSTTPINSSTQCRIETSQFSAADWPDAHCRQR